MGIRSRVSVRVRVRFIPKAAATCGARQYVTVVAVVEAVVEAVDSAGVSFCVNYSFGIKIYIVYT